MLVKNNMENGRRNIGAKTEVLGYGEEDGKWIIFKFKAQYAVQNLTKRNRMYISMEWGRKLK